MRPRAAQAPATGVLGRAPKQRFGGLLDRLATLTRNQIRYHGTDTEIPMLTEATPDQRRAFHLINTPIPLSAA
jgi:hypothetical protein